MNTLQKLIQDVSESRSLYIHQINALTESQVQWKPWSDVWNITEITEHLFWAEHGGIVSMWKTYNFLKKKQQNE